MAERLFGSSK